MTATPVHAAEEEARVLILNGLDPYLPAYLAIDAAMRADLATETAMRRGWEVASVGVGYLHVDKLLQAVSVPIDRYTYESIDALEDFATEWRLRRQITVDTLRLKGETIPGDMLPPLEFSVIDASFDAVRDPVEREYLLNLPTTLSLPPEAIDRLRSAAAQVLRESAPFRKLVADLSLGN